jgi:hypothetical protein
MDNIDPMDLDSTPPRFSDVGHRTTQFEDQSAFDRLDRPTVAFGILYERLDDECVSSILRDVLTLVGSLPAIQRLAIYSPNAIELRAAFGSTIDADFISGQYDSCKIWKAYYYEKKPVPPQGVKISVFSQIKPKYVKQRPKLSDRYSMLDVDKLNDYKLVSPGSSPNYKTMPTWTPANPWAPAIRIFSSSKKKEPMKISMFASVPSEVEQKELAESSRFSSEEFARKLNFLADVYKISSNPDDYFMKPVIMFHTDMPNRNGYVFPTDSMVEWNPDRHMIAYETWKYAPLHIEHKSEDPTKAIGIIADVIFKKALGVCNDKIYKVIALAAVDRTKNPGYTSKIESGEYNSWSMGCDANRIFCTYCGKDQGECKHLDPEAPVVFYELNGVIVCRGASGIGAKELSSVGTPAWPMAVSTKTKLTFGDK